MDALREILPPYISMWDVAQYWITMAVALAVYLALGRS